MRNLHKNLRHRRHEPMGHVPREVEVTLGLAVALLVALVSIGLLTGVDRWSLDDRVLFAVAAGCAAASGCLFDFQIGLSFIARRPPSRTLLRVSLWMARCALALLGAAWAAALVLAVLLLSDG